MAAAAPIRPQNRRLARLRSSMAGRRGASSCHVLLPVPTRFVASYRPPAVHVHTCTQVTLYRWPLGNAHVRTGGSYRYLAANLDVQYCSPTLGLLFMASVSHACSCPRNHCAVCRACVRVTPTAARIPRAVHYRNTVETSRAKATSSMHQDPPPLTSPNRETRRRLACSCPFLPSRREASPTTVRWPCAGTHTAHLSSL